MLEKIKQYVKEEKFYFTIYFHTIHIMNYKRLITLEENQISFQGEKQKIVLKGKDFALQKLLEKEALITGEVTNVEVSYE